MRVRCARWVNGLHFLYWSVLELHAGAVESWLFGDHGLEESVHCAVRCRVVGL